MARRRFSNLLALAVLSCLSERPMHPYEISQTLRHRGKDQSIKLNYGALYSVVDSLAGAGYIEPFETVREGRRPERTVYRITDTGRDEHELWLSDLVSTPRREYHSLEAALALVAGLRPTVVARLLGERLIRLRQETASVEEMLRASAEMGLPPLFSVELEFRAAMLRAETEFVGRFAASLRDGTLPGVAAWDKLHDLVEQGLSIEEIVADPVRHMGPDGAVLLPLAGEGPSPVT